MSGVTDSETEVWVVEYCPPYDSGWVRGVYDSPETAKAEWPGDWEPLPSDLDIRDEWAPGSDMTLSPRKIRKLATS